MQNHTMGIKCLKIQQFLVNIIFVIWQEPQSVNIKRNIYINNRSDVDLD